MDSRHADSRQQKRVSRETLTRVPPPIWPSFANEDLQQWIVMANAIENEEEEALFRQFQFERLLNEDPLTKTVSLLGSIGDQRAIINLEKTAFDIAPENLARVVDDTIMPWLHLIQRNDIYRWYLGGPSPGRSHSKATLIYPATEVHIRKQEKQPRRMVRETPEIYEQYVEKYIETMKGPRIQWVYNVIEHKAEVERIVYEDPDPESGFLLLPDLKWDEKTMSALYLCAILRRRDFSSIRDLNIHHVLLLIKIRDSIIRATTAKWPEIGADQLRLYFHYHPSYYHMHIHIVHTDFNGSDGMAVGKAWLLDDVIEQLPLLGEEGFKKKTMTVIVGEESDLWKNVYSKVS